MVQTLYEQDTVLQYNSMLQYALHQCQQPVSHLAWQILKGVYFFGGIKLVYAVYYIAD